MYSKIQQNTLITYKSHELKIVISKEYSGLASSRNGINLSGAFSFSSSNNVFEESLKEVKETIFPSYFNH